MNILAFSLLLIPSLAMANTAAPLLPLLSAWSSLLLPVIFILEALYYKRLKIPSPFKLSLQSNLISSLIGFFLWTILGLTVLNIPFESPANLKYWMGRLPNKDYTRTIQGMVIAPYIFLIPNCLLSAWIEFFSAKKLKTWRNTDLSFMPFFKASMLSYLLISLFLFFSITINFIKML